MLAEYPEETERSPLIKRLTTVATEVALWDCKILWHSLEFVRRESKNLKTKKEMVVSLCIRHRSLKIKTAYSVIWGIGTVEVIPLITMADKVVMQDMEETGPRKMKADPKTVEIGLPKNMLD